MKKRTKTRLLMVTGFLGTPLLLIMAGLALAAVN